jgi:ribosomal-protein-alanine N-acetyltransferase
MQEYDVPAVLKIEWMSFSMPWSGASFYQEIHKPYALSKIVLDECHILNLAIHPEFRGRGIATTLMEDILREAIAKGCRSFYLEVRVSNEGARMFYEHMGFSIAGLRKKYYTSPIEDAIIMVLKV